MSDFNIGLVGPEFGFLIEHGIVVSEKTGDITKDVLYKPVEVKVTDGDLQFVRLRPKNFVDVQVVLFND